MNKFVEAAEEAGNVALTANLGATNRSSLNACVDLFAIIGNRNQDFSREFDRAYQENADIALRILLWGRDIRGGAGERQTFRNHLKYLEKKHPDVLIKVLHKVPEVGRWDDLLIFTNDEVKKAAYAHIVFALGAGNALCAKWMPRRGKIAHDLAKYLEFGSSTIKSLKKEKKIEVTFDKKGRYGDTTTEFKHTFKSEKSLRRWLARPNNVGRFEIKDKKEFVSTSNVEGSAPGRGYRQLISSLTKAVETKMTQGKWNEIDYNHVPSLAASRYQKAFARNDEARYNEYKEGLKTGESKINVGAIYPYDVVKSVQMGDEDVALAQWESLPNYMGDKRIIPMVDSSGSMGSFDYYGMRPAGTEVKGTVRPIDAAVSLGLYCADKLAGDFHGMFLTFSSDTKLQKLTGNLIEKMKQIASAHWTMGTNIERAMNQILKLAVDNEVPQDEMPEVLLILSDMEFDRCVEGEQTIYKATAKKYEKAGYQMPQVVFWNLNSRPGNYPVTFKTSGTALVSGFSPAIMKSVLAVDIESFSPVNVMLEAVMTDRYKVEL